MFVNFSYSTEKAWHTFITFKVHWTCLLLGEQQSCTVLSCSQLIWYWRKDLVLLVSFRSDVLICMPGFIKVSQWWSQPSHKALGSQVGNLKRKQKWLCELMTKHAADSPRFPVEWPLYGACKLTLSSPTRVRAWCFITATETPTKTASEVFWTM